MYQFVQRPPPGGHAAYVARAAYVGQRWVPGSRSAAQAATWARELKPSLPKILATCRAAVAGLMVSSSAMPRLDRPRAISRAISSSLAVSTPEELTRPGSGAGR